MPSRRIPYALVREGWGKDGMEGGERKTSVNKIIQTVGG